MPFDSVGGDAIGYCGSCRSVTVDFGPASASGSRLLESVMAVSLPLSHSELTYGVGVVCDETQRGGTLE